MIEGPRADVRTIVGGGIKLGVFTAIGVVIFALVSRPMAAGTAETLVQSFLILLGGSVFAYYPAYAVRPRDADTIAWSALLGLVGALAFTVIDTAVLRPLDIYRWTWDKIGGGSGFWYVPVWWMGSAVLAWFGAWVSANRDAASLQDTVAAAAQTVVIAVALFAVITLTAWPFHSAMMALSFAVGLVFHVVISRVLRRE
ncbi:MAG: hypothetical protein ACE5PT_02985 [Gemmatimonadales bacterium]